MPYLIRYLYADSQKIGAMQGNESNGAVTNVDGEYKIKVFQGEAILKDNANTSRKDDIETELLFGKGRAYGVEFLLRKRSGRFTGWVSYTLSKSEKKIDGINTSLANPTSNITGGALGYFGVYTCDTKEIIADW